MDVFNRFYSKALPLIDKLIRENHAKLPVEIQNEINSLFGKIILLFSELYKSDILKEKYNLDVNLSYSGTSESDVPKRFLKNSSHVKFAPINV